MITERRNKENTEDEDKSTRQNNKHTHMEFRIHVPDLCCSVLREESCPWRFFSIDDKLFERATPRGNSCAGHRVLELESEKKEKKIE